MSWTPHWRSLEYILCIKAATPIQAGRTQITTIQIWVPRLVRTPRPYWGEFSRKPGFPPAGEFGCQGGGRAGGMGGRADAVVLQARQVDKEHCPAAGRVGKSDLAAQSLNNLFHNAQTQPGAGLLPRIGIVGLSEPSEYAISELCRNAMTVVPDRYADLVLAVLGCHHHFRP
jgi:hypothetical protein